MQAVPCLAGARSLCALALMFGSTSCSFAQIPTTLPSRSARDADAPTAAPKTEPPTAPAALSTAEARRAVRTSWLGWPHPIDEDRAQPLDDPCEHACTAPPTAAPITQAPAVNEPEPTYFTTPPLIVPSAATSAVKSAPSQLQPTGMTTPAMPENYTGDITDADRRFAEMAGTIPTRPVVAAPANTWWRRLTERTPSRIPEIRLQPIGVVPPMSEQ